MPFGLEPHAFGSTPQPQALQVCVGPLPLLLVLPPLDPPKPGKPGKPGSPIPPSSNEFELHLGQPHAEHTPHELHPHSLQ